MNRFSTAIILAATMMATSTEGFAPAVNMNTMRRTAIFSTQMETMPQRTTSPQHEMNEEQPAMASTSAEPIEKKKPLSKKKAPAAHGKKGPLAPLVLLAKKILGDEKLNEIRGKAIGAHSKVIKGFVDTHESAFGETALRTLFNMADTNKNGSIEQEELATALKRLGFDLKEKQIQGIFERADKDGSGTLDYDEWRTEAPGTLRTNLIKMAKRNGGDLGFLV
mmetsp:Transcript_10789/g.31191  ORF Transcript_10789/g.31191 Transcript_10789/m.31191 type:complete len:222 (+) Transcript_10789:43-708(+)